MSTFKALENYEILDNEENENENEGKIIQKEIKKEIKKDNDLYIDIELLDQKNENIKVNHNQNLEIDIEKNLENNKIFNNDFTEIKPIKLGNSYAFIYFRGQPIITIGPHCNNKN
jgi:hypothetical protein